MVFNKQQFLILLSKETYSSLANRSGVSMKTIQNLVKEPTRSFSSRTIEKLANALECRALSLVMDRGEVEQSA